LEPPEPPPPTTIKTLHETIMWKLGAQLQQRYEPAPQLPDEIRTLLGRLDEGQES
jgi:hypothetical protein